MATSPINVIIIGAGTGGLCLAQGLKRAGIGVGVYERDRTRRDGLEDVVHFDLSTSTRCSRASSSTPTAR